MLVELWHWGCSMPSDNVFNTPISVTVAFPVASFGILSDAPPYTVLVVGTGHPGTQVIKSAALANYEGGDDPVNAAELALLAAQISADWYSWRLASLEVRYESAVAYIADGMHDIEYIHGPSMLSTSVHRSEWEPDAGLLQHAGTFGSSSVAKCCKLCDEVIAITTGDLLDGGVYDATIEPYESGVFVPGTPIWFLDLAESASLTADDLYPALVVRDGSDAPVTGPGGPFLVSIVPGNVGNTLTDTAAWALLTDPTPTVWAAGTYDYGDYVSDSGHNYLEVNAAGTTGTPGSSADWLQADVLNSAGGYSSGAGYP